MSNFVIAAAQSSSIKGEIKSNINTHVKFVHTAIEHKVNFIIFPELSLTGYEPEIASETAIDINDKRLSPLKDLAEQNNITIVAGAPIFCPNGKPFIGAIIFDSRNHMIYVKNHLHPGEERYFSQGEKKSCVLHKDGENIGIAICADINHSSHAEEAAMKGASIYAAGVLMMNGYFEAVEQLRYYSIKYSMAVLMANYGSPTGGYKPAGKSAVWDPSGNLLAIANETGDDLVLLIKQSNDWFGKVIRIS